MNNDDNKGFSRFQFSTELDRGEKKEEVVEKVEEATTEEKPKKTSRKRNYKKNSNRRNPRRNNRRSNNKKDESVELVKDNMEKEVKEEVTSIELLDDVDEPTETISFEGGTGKAFETVDTAPEENTFEVPDFKVEPEIPTVEEIPTEDVQEEYEEVTPAETEENVVEEEQVPEESVEEEKIPEEIVEDAPVEEKSEEVSAYDQELSAIREKGINLNEAREINLDHTLYRDQYFVQNGTSEDEVVEEVKAAIEEEKNAEVPAEETTHTIKKVYLSFQARVLLLILGIIILFGTACFIIFSTLQSNVAEKVNFLEKSTIHYQVCQSGDPYNAQCEQEGSTYNSNNTANVHIDYHYEALFEEAADYNLSYHVAVVHKIYDRYDPNKILYEGEDLIKEKTAVQGGQNPAAADVGVEIDYQKYYNFVNDYKSKYSSNADSNLSVILYLDDGVETRNVGEVLIPLGDSTFEITRKNVEDSTQEYILEEKDWTNTNTLYIIIGSVLVLLSLFLLFHLTKLALAITGKKSKYQDLLMSILNEYDRLIVIARDGYESADKKEIIKVYTFDELLDKRSILNKPIIYSRVNNVKSEFIVEDETCIYKYVLKEADMGE